jgi:hypothetical protein
MMAFAAFLQQVNFLLYTMEFVWNLCIPIRSRSRREPESQLEPQEEAEHRNATYKQEQQEAVPNTYLRTFSSLPSTLLPAADPVFYFYSYHADPDGTASTKSEWYFCLYRYGIFLQDETSDHNGDSDSGTTVRTLLLDCYRFYQRRGYFPAKA